MPDFALEWSVVLVLLTASFLYTDKRRRLVTALVVLLSALGAYLLQAALPSLPQSLAFSLCFGIAFASLETKLFPWLVAGSIGLSSFYLLSGVQTEAVSIGLLIALFSRYIVEWFLRSNQLKLPKRFFYPVYSKSAVTRAEEEGESFEYRRKAFHFLGGLALIGLIMVFGRTTSLTFLCAAIVSSLLVISAIAQTGKSIFGPIIEKLERHGKRPLDGVLWFLAGTTLLLLFAGSSEFVFAGIYVMAAGDAAAAIFGKRFGSLKWPHNRKKSIAGSLAFAAASLPALFLVNSPIIYVSILACALLESLNWEIDDNILAAIVFAVASNV